MRRAAPRRLRIAVLAGLCLATGLAAAATTPVMDEREAGLRQVLHVPPAMALRYLDENGKPLTLDRFMAAAGTGRQFTKVTDVDRRIVWLKLTPPARR